MRAATELLVEGGPEAVTVDGVVARSGVAKSTVYRHWQTRDHLLAETFKACVPQFEAPPPEVAFETGLIELVHHMIAIVTDERWRRFFPAMLLLREQQPALAAIDSDMKAQQLGVYRELFERGVAEGVLPPSSLSDLELSMMLLLGPVLMASIMDDIDLDDAFADRVVEQFLAGQVVRADAASIRR